MDTPNYNYIQNNSYWITPWAYDGGGGGDKKKKKHPDQNR